MNIASRPRWLNRNVAAMGVTSLFSDAGHEAATAVLPGFLAALGFPPAALGIIEGIADALSSFVKLGAGWLGDRRGRRWGLAVGGYLMTGAMPAFFVVARSWPLVLFGRAFGWFGRGIRGPLRDAMLAESVAPEARGRAFGFHRAGDTIGAVLGPVGAVVVLAIAHSNGADDIGAFATVFWWALIPGLFAALTFAVFVRDPGASVRSTGTFLGTIRAFPRAFRTFLTGVGLFGLGDFAPTLLILAATTVLTPRFGFVEAGAIAGALYVLRNAVYALGSFPIGALSDRTHRPIPLLAGGYLVGALVAAGVLLAFALNLDEPAYFALLFIGSGLLAATEDTLEGVATAELGGDGSRATAFGLLASVNGVGDLVASAGLGILWTLTSAQLAFGAAATLMFLGAGFLFASRDRA